MRLRSILPLIALVSLGACDSAKLAEATGIRPAACTPGTQTACAAAPAVNPASMPPETAPATNTQTADAATTRQCVDACLAGGPVQVATPRRIRATHRRHTARPRRMAAVSRPVDLPPRVMAAPQPPTEVWVDRDIDRTAPVYGQQAYNRYPRTISPPVIYNGLHHPHEPARYVPRQEVYIYPSGSTDRRGHDGGGDACQCTTPAAGRDRAGYLTWPGKTEFRSN